MIKKIFTFLLFSTIFIQLSYSEWDKNSSIEDIFQESVNKNFKPIDKSIEIFLNNLNTDKSYCFWKDRKKRFTQCVDDIEKMFSINGQYTIWEGGYTNACAKSLAETIEKQEKKSISLLEAGTILDKKNIWTCTNLYKFKLSMYKSVAYDILKRNKYEILKDEHKLFTQKNRTKYDKIVELIRINLWYLERLWKKWNSKTK